MILDIFVNSQLEQLSRISHLEMSLVPQWTLYIRYALNLGDVEITELWNLFKVYLWIYSVHCLLTLGVPPTSMWYIHRVSGLGPSCMITKVTRSQQEKMYTVFYLERLVFMGQHTGIAISPKKYFFVKNCLSQEPWILHYPSIFQV